MADMETMAAGTPQQPPHMMDEGSTEGSADEDAEIVDTIKEVEGEDAVINALGIQIEQPHTPNVTKQSTAPEESYNVVPNPEADVVDLSDLRGTRAPTTGTERKDTVKKEETNDDLEALAELVPELRARNRGSSGEGHTMTMDEPVVQEEGEEEEEVAAAAAVVHEGGDDEAVEVEVEEKEEASARSPSPRHMVPSQYSTALNPTETKRAKPAAIEHNDSMQVQRSTDGETEDNKRKSEPAVEVTKMAAAAPKKVPLPPSTDDGKLGQAGTFDNDDQNLGGFEDVDSENAVDSNDGDRFGDGIKGVHGGKAQEKYDVSSAVSLSTATQTHEVRMPMYLPTFKPATGCTNASDFIVRCFVARLRSGITVVKHGRSRWCKSRLRILHIHPDGRSLSWKPAVGEPNSSKRPPKLDLSTCREVRHAWSPDPLNPMFTGTAILRQKCEAANAHKSFALIFPKRTVDITAVTADQCKVLMEGFSALCFRLQVANLAGRGNKKGKDGAARGSGDDEEVATTASVTLTNNSTQLSPTGSGNPSRSKRGSRR